MVDMEAFGVLARLSRRQLMICWCRWCGKALWRLMDLRRRLLLQHTGAGSRRGTSGGLHLPQPGVPAVLPFLLE